MTHLWERKHKKENTKSCLRPTLPPLPRSVSLRCWHFPPATIDFFPSLLHIRLKNGSVSPAVTLRHFAFSSLQHQGFIFFLSFSLTMRQKKLNATKRGAAEGQMERQKRRLEYGVKWNFQSLHHFCLSLYCHKKSWVGAFFCTNRKLKLKVGGAKGRCTATYSIYWLYSISATSQWYALDSFILVL